MGRRMSVRKGPVFDMDGILLVDKPADWTSFDVVNCVRSRFNIPKVGHCGTLDPAATGLLVLVLNNFTKLSGQLSGDDKSYSGTLLLGKETDTLDLDGEVISEQDYSKVSEENLLELASGFLGAQQQLPPMVSAVKQNGKRLYELARKGVEVEREPRTIEIKKFELTRINLPEADFVIECSKGTYVRSVVSDLGKKAGCGAVLAKLRRLSCGNFKLTDAVSMDVIKGWEAADLAVYLRKILSSQLETVDQKRF